MVYLLSLVAEDFDPYGIPADHEHAITVAVFGRKAERGSDAVPQVPLSVHVPRQELPWQLRGAQRPRPQTSKTPKCYFHPLVLFFDFHIPQVCRSNHILQPPVFALLKSVAKCHVFLALLLAGSALVWL